MEADIETDIAHEGAAIPSAPRAKEAPMFVRSASFVKTTREWAALAPRGSFESAARAFAKANMVAVVMRADDSAITYCYDVMRDRVVKTTHKNVEWA